MRQVQILLDCVHAQADLNRRWVCMSESKFSDARAEIYPRKK